eukprot:1283415-Pleurochrysis_carterae.AAC.2
MGLCPSDCRVEAESGLADSALVGPEEVHVFETFLRHLRFAGKSMLGRSMLLMWQKRSNRPRTRSQLPVGLLFAFGRRGVGVAAMPPGRMTKQETTRMISCAVRARRATRFST